MELYEHKKISVVEISYWKKKKSSCFSKNIFKRILEYAFQVPFISNIWTSSVRKIKDHNSYTLN